MIWFLFLWSWSMHLVGSDEISEKRAQLFQPVNILRLSASLQEQYAKDAERAKRLASLRPIKVLSEDELHNVKLNREIEFYDRQELEQDKPIISRLSASALQIINLSDTYFLVEDTRHLKREKELAQYLPDGIETEEEEKDFLIILKNKKSKIFLKSL